ncbi:hypothetical protein CLOP_g14722, partial [Closterium sp. NIES-67]
LLPRRGKRGGKFLQPMGMRHVCGRCSRTFGQTGVVQAAITSPAVSPPPFTIPPAPSSPMGVLWMLGGRCLWCGQW